MKRARRVEEEEGEEKGKKGETDRSIGRQTLTEIHQHIRFNIQAVILMKNSSDSRDKQTERLTGGLTSS